MAFSVEEISYSSMISWYHKLPRFNFTFNTVTNNFSPESEAYWQGVLFWCAIFGAWLILTLLIFIFYFCCFCCQTQKTLSTNKKSTCGCLLKILLTVLACILCTAIGLGFYGNNEISKGMTKFIDGATYVRKSFYLIRRRSFSGMKILDNISVLKLREEIQRNTDSQSKQSKKINDIEESLRLLYFYDFTIDLNQTKLPQLIDYSNNIELVRWASTISVFGWHLLIAVILFTAICRSSKSFFMFSCILSVITVVFGWSSVAVYIAAGLILGDFCQAPNAYIASATLYQINPKVLQYLTTCKIDNPYRQVIAQSYLQISKIDSSLNAIQRWADKKGGYPEIDEQIRLITTNIESLYSYIGELTSLVNCRSYNPVFASAITGICKETADGVSASLTALIICGLLCTLIVFLSSCAWKKVQSYNPTLIHSAHSRKANHIDTDETDPFLPHDNLSVESRDRSRFVNSDRFDGYESVNTGIRVSGAGFMMPSQGPDSTPLGLTTDSSSAHGHHTPPPAYDGGYHAAHQKAAQHAGTLPIRMGSQQRIGGGSHNLRQNHRYKLPPISSIPSSQHHHTLINGNPPLNTTSTTIGNNAITSMITPDSTEQQQQQQINNSGGLATLPATTQHQMIHHHQGPHYHPRSGGYRTLATTTSTSGAAGGGENSGVGPTTSTGFPLVENHQQQPWRQRHQQNQMNHPGYLGSLRR